MRSPLRLTLVAMLVATPLLAQRGTRQTTTPRTQQPAPLPAKSPADTGKHAYALDFQDQDLKVVLSALAEAGNLNMTYSNVPARRVTLRMGTAATQAEIVAMIQGIADANDLKVTHNGSLIQIVGEPVVTPPTPQQQLLQNAVAAELKVYTYPLKHASATALAPLLTSLFSNTTATSGATIVTNPGTVQFNTALPGAGTTGAGNAGRGTGGRGAGGFGGGANGVGVGVGGGGANPLQGLAGLQQLFGGSAAGANVRVVAEPTTNTLFIRASASDYALIQQVVASVDLRPLQVLIEVTIAEVTRTHDLDVGVSGLASAAKNRPADSAFVASTASARDFILRLTGGGGAVDYNVALNALSSRGNTKVLSLPVIIAQNNVQAVLNVGESRPFVQVNQSVTTGTVPTTVQTIQYIDVGTTLTLTPNINRDGYVNLTVDQTDNSATTEVEFDAPVISKREATTQVFLKDGQTTVLGGLAGKSMSKTVSGIPILDKIPIIGTLLFGNTTESTTTSELYLFLTPHIISGDGDIDRLRDAVKGTTELLKQEQVPMGARIVPQADTIHLPTAADSLIRRQDSIRRADSVARAKRPAGGPGGR